MEIWKDIVGYEGLYQVSNMGKVKRLAGWKCKKERVLQQPVKNGYYYATLSKNGVRHKVYFHQLVMYTFKGKSTLQIDHIDGNKQNNKISNLEFVTHRENAQRYFSTKKHSSIYCGVRYRPEKKSPWIAEIRIGKKSKHLGSYKTEIEASNSYKSALKNITNEHNNK